MNNACQLTHAIADDVSRSIVNCELLNDMYFRFQLNMNAQRMIIEAEKLYPFNHICDEQSFKSSSKWKRGLTNYRFNCNKNVKSVQTLSA